MVMDGVHAGAGAGTGTGTDADVDSDADSVSIVPPSQKRRTQPASPHPDSDTERRDKETEDHSDPDNRGHGRGQWGGARSPGTPVLGAPLRRPPSPSPEPGPGPGPGAGAGAAAEDRSDSTWSEDMPLARPPKAGAERQGQAQPGPGPEPRSGGRVEDAEAALLAALSSNLGPAEVEHALQALEDVKDLYTGVPRAGMGVEPGLQRQFGQLLVLRGAGLDGITGRDMVESGLRVLVNMTPGAIVEPMTAVADAARQWFLDTLRAANDSPDPDADAQAPSPLPGAAARVHTIAREAACLVIGAVINCTGAALVPSADRDLRPHSRGAAAAMAMVCDVMAHVLPGVDSTAIATAVHATTVLVLEFGARVLQTLVPAQQLQLLRVLENHLWDDPVADRVDTPTECGRTVRELELAIMLLHQPHVAPQGWVRVGLPAKAALETLAEAAARRPGVPPWTPVVACLHLLLVAAVAGTVPVDVPPGPLPPGAALPVDMLKFVTETLPTLLTPRAHWLREGRDGAAADSYPAVLNRAWLPCLREVLLPRMRAGTPGVNPVTAMAWSTLVLEPVLGWVRWAGPGSITAPGVPRPPWVGSLDLWMEVVAQMVALSPPPSACMAITFLRGLVVPKDRMYTPSLGLIAHRTLCADHMNTQQHKRWVG